MKHLWSRPIDCAAPDGRARFCRKCGAQVRRHQVKGTLTATVGPHGFRMPALERVAYVWSYRPDGFPKAGFWSYLWEIPPCPVTEQPPRCAATRRYWGVPIRCQERKHDQQIRHHFRGVPGGGDGNVVGVEW